MGEGGNRNGQEFLIGEGGDVFEVDSFLQIGTEQSIQLSVVGPLPDGLDFAFTSQLAADETDVTLRYTLTNSTAAAFDDVTFIAFADVEIDEHTNSFTNEYATVEGELGAGPADSKPDSYEVDEAGFTFGDIIDNLFTGRLDNTNAIPDASPECVAMALGFALGTILPRRTRHDRDHAL